MSDMHNEARISTKEMTLTLPEKLQMMNDEVQQLHQFCIKQGYSPSEIESFATPLLQAVKAYRRKVLAWRCIYVGVLIAIVAGLFYVDPVYRLLCALTRLAAIQVLPLWDWTRLYNAKCLVDNPYFIEQGLTEEDCKLCEDNVDIPRMSNISHAVMSEDFLYRDRPVIVTDALIGWPASQKFNIHFLHELYSQEEILRDFLPCMFASNIRLSVYGPRHILGKASRGEISNWYAHWENCAKSAAKVVRQFYQRPYFIPPMIEMGTSNWLLVASQYVGKKYKLFDFAMPMVWFAQIRGATKVELIPRVPCESHCSKLYATLQEGEILTVTDLLWEMRYLPVGQNENIVISAGGYFD